ncbi:hypothetical protein HDU83_003292 [Entophlyctis luteolus]|nr:hypothetical protein HDU83_003292 [Entophlyctis luteolus]
MLVIFALLAAVAAAQTFTNPVFYEDLADLDILRVNDTYYYSASTMHYSPGAPILRSYDLVNWEYIGHSVPTLAFGSKYDLTGGQQAYVKGIYASFFNYRKSTNTWYWGGCVEYSSTYIYTSHSVTGPWSQAAHLPVCLYDCGLVIDDTDTMYVAYGGTTINVAQLSSDGLSIVKSQAVYTSSFDIEGSRFYHLNGYYYIFVTHPASEEYVLRATSPFGPYTIQPVVQSIGSPVLDSGNPHQGGIVSTAQGNWYYMAFVDNYPGGRNPVLAPLTWSNGWPQVTKVNGAWGASYPYPAPEVSVKSPTGTDTFSGTSLGPEWEWNHNPDTTKFTVNNMLTLSTATVTSDLYAARNTLTHRIIGPVGTGTVLIDTAGMQDGDICGFAMLRDSSAWIGVKRVGTAYTVVMKNGLTMTSTWSTASTGTEVASASFAGGKVWLRITANIGASTSRTATFYYSTDGTAFASLGPAYALNTAWEFFLGYRFAIFNYATSALGGYVRVYAFQMCSGTSGCGTLVAPGVTALPSTTAGLTKTTTRAITTAAATTGAAGSCSALYGQCGGNGWTGPTCCSSGKCTYSNEYYSQCL